MRSDHKNESKKLKVLLLGTGESGKSTIFKQMKLLYGRGYTMDDRVKYRPFILSNLVEGAGELGKGLETFCGGADDGSDLQIALKIIAESRGCKELTQELVDAILLLRDSDISDNALENRNKMQIQDSWEEFVECSRKFPEWGGKTWVPSTDDILKCRVRTTGVIDEQFIISDTPFQMFDVGGQRNERRKWMHCFDDVTSLIFVTAINEYDQILFEDSTQNRLVESFVLFEEYANKDYFEKAALIVFFNKTDLFEEKYLHNKVPLNITGLFPGAPTGEPDLKMAHKWFVDSYKKRIKDPSKTMFDHFTCATDTKSLDVVIKATSHAILMDNLAVLSGHV